MKTECPACKSPLSFDETAFGKAGRCKSCGASLSIGKDGRVSLRPQNPATDGEQRPTSRWIDWVAAGSLALLFGLVLGIFLAKPTARQLRDKKTAANEAESRALAAEEQVEHLKPQLSLARNRAQKAERAASSGERRANELVRLLENAESRAQGAQGTIREWKAAGERARTDGQNWHKKAEIAQSTVTALKKELELQQDRAKEWQELATKAVGTMQQLASTSRTGGEATRDAGAELKRAQDRLDASRKRLRELKQAQERLEASRKRFRELEKARLKHAQPQIRPLPPLVGGGVYPGAGMRHWISEVTSSGQYIFLEDGSVWEVSFLHQIRSMLWLPVSNIVVMRSDSVLYPYKLLNSNREQFVHAKYIGQK